MRVFISGVDTYVGAAVKKLLLEDLKAKLEDQGGELQDDERLEIVGSVAPGTAVPKGVSEVVSSDDAERVCALASSADQIVLDTHKSVLEATKIVKSLKSPFEGSKSLVLVSSLHTWLNTPKEYAASEEESKEEKYYAAFKEENFMSRKPPPSYLVHKTLESQVLALAHDSLCTTVIAGGILYGDRQHMLHSIFQEAWLCKQVKIPAFANGGKNFLPMVHVYDLSRAVINALSSPPTAQYVVAVDESQPRLCEVICAINKSLQPNTSRTVPVATIEETEEMLLDNKDWVKLQCDFKFESGGAIDALIGDKWTSKAGFLENISELTKEFITAKNLKPVKVVLMGPPGSGKSVMASKISKHYYIPIVNVETCITTLKDLVSLDTETNNINPSNEGEEKESDQEEKGSEEEGDNLASKAKKLYDVVSTYTNVDDVPPYLRQQLVRFVLQTPPCLNQGYVLDGLPATFQESIRIFSVSTEEEEFSWQELDESKQDSEDETKESDTGEIILQDNIKPTAVITLQADDNVLRERAIEKAAGEAYDAEQNFEQKMKFFGKNNAFELPKTPLGFFENICRIETMQLDTGSDNLENCMEAASLYIEQGGKAFNYHPTEEEKEEEMNRQKAELLLIEERERMMEQEEQHFRALEEEERMKNDHMRKTALKKQEDELLEIRSKPLREYLLQNVMPTLSAGLVETTRVKPADPVDFLAEYLFTHATTKK